MFYLKGLSAWFPLPNLNPYRKCILLKSHVVFDRSDKVGLERML